MIEDKIKQEYEWQHSEIGQPTLDELFSKINEVHQELQGKIAKDNS